MKALAGQRVVQVSLGSRDAQTLALSEDGSVYSWGDGDFGKLGRGGSDGCNVPHVVERLSGLGVCQIECGAQFSLALTKAGQVWTWSVCRVRVRVRVSLTVGVCQIECGAQFSLALTKAGQVWTWSVCSRYTSNPVHTTEADTTQTGQFCWVWPGGVNWSLETIIPRANFVFGKRPVCTESRDVITGVELGFEVNAILR